MRLDLSRIGQIAMSVADTDRAEAFYENALGLRKLFRFGDLVFFDCAGLRLMLAQGGGSRRHRACLAALFPLRRHCARRRRAEAARRDLRGRAAPHRRDGRPRSVDGLLPRSRRSSDGAHAGSAEGLCSRAGAERSRVDDNLEAATMAYWLFKTEPDSWSWDEQKKKGAAGQEWDGVRNFQARANMRTMKKGDRGFFYHTGDEKRGRRHRRGDRRGAPGIEGRHRHLEVRRPEGGRRRAEAGDARRHQGREAAEGHGARR